MYQSAFLSQPRSQGLFPGQGKDPGNEVDFEPRISATFSADELYRGA